MATSAEFMRYVCGQMSGAGPVLGRKMFGEYGLYLNGKFFGTVCDNQVFLKITDAGRQKLSEPLEAPPYKGAKPCFLIEQLEDRDYLAGLVLATCSQLPEPKEKKGKPKKKD